MATNASAAISRKMASSKEAHSKMVDDAIDQLHNSDVPAHVGVPAMHALLLAKHYTLKGIKIPDHLQDPPKVGQAENGDTSKESGDEEEGNDGD